MSKPKARVGDIVAVHYFDVGMSDDTSETDLLNTNPVYFIVYGRLVHLDNLCHKVVVEDDTRKIEHNSYIIPTGCIDKVEVLKR